MSKIKKLYFTCLLNVKTHLRNNVYFYYRHVCKLLFVNAIFRLILFTFTCFLVYVGVSENIASLTCTVFVRSCIIRSCIRAKHKMSHVGKSIINISIVIAFWYGLNKGLNVDFISLVLGNYIFINFKSFDAFDFNYSNILDSLNLHKKCIGDPAGPNGDQPSENNPYTLVNDPDDVYHDRISLQDYRNKFQNNPGLVNYKENVVIGGVTYDTLDAQKRIALHNQKCVPTKEHEMPFKKGFMMNKALYEDGTYRCFISPYEFVSELQSQIYTLILEYNTLKKAKIFYNENGMGLSDEFKNAFEIWQKRQLGIYTCRDLPALYSDILAETSSLFSINTHAVKNHFVLPNYFDPEVVYYEIRENLLYVELDLMQKIKILDEIKDKKFNYFRLSNEDFDNFIAYHSRIFIDNHRAAYNVLLKNNLDNFDSKSAKALESMFKMQVKSVFRDYEMQEHARDNNLGDIHKYRPKFPSDSYLLNAKKLYIEQKPHFHILDNFQGLAHYKKLVFNGYFKSFKPQIVFLRNA